MYSNIFKILITSLLFTGLLSSCQQGDIELDMVIGGITSDNASEQELSIAVLPSVSSIQPANGDDGVAVNSNIIVTFDEPAYPKKLTVNSGGNECTGTVQISSDKFSSCVMLEPNPIAINGNRTFEFDPVDCLEYSTIYTVKVIESSTGVSEQAQVFEFTTGATEVSSCSPNESETVEDSVNNSEGSANENDNPAPTILTFSPNDGESEVDINSTISITFDMGMDTSSIIANTNSLCGGSVQLSTDGFVTCIPMASSLPVISGGDQIFTFAPATPLSLSNEYKIRVTTSVMDLSGSTLETIHTSLNGFTTPDISTWLFADGSGGDGINYDSLQNAQKPKMASFNSKLYSCWEEHNGTSSQIRVSVFNNDLVSPTFSFVDGDGLNGINFNSGESATESQFVEYNNKMYIGWVEANGTSGQIRLAVYNGNDQAPAWNFIDGGGIDGINKNAGFDAQNLFLAVFDSKLYGTWAESNGAATQIRVAVYNGDDGSPQWSFVDGDGVAGINTDTLQNAQSPHLTVFSSKLYIAWHEANASGDQIRTAVYNSDDLSPAWGSVDGGGLSGINFDTNEDALNPRFVAYNSKLYITWQEFKSVKSQIRISVYNGNDAAPTWNFVDGNLTTGINYNVDSIAQNASLTVLNTKLYAIWQEKKGNAFQTRMTVFNGNVGSPDWSFVDGNTLIGVNWDDKKNAQFPRLEMHKSTLYAIWSEENGTATQIRLAVGQ